MQRKLFKRLAIGKSNIAGWGLYNLEDIKKGDFIMEYVGEIIDDDEALERDKWNCIEKITYMFTLNNSVKIKFFKKYLNKIDIDSKSMGNKLRFANHSKANENCTAKVFFTEGFHKVGLFALKDISKFDEILFDYDGKNELWKRFPWINDDKKKLSRHISDGNMRSKSIGKNNSQRNENWNNSESITSDQSKGSRMLRRKRNRSLIRINSMKNIKKKINRKLRRNYDNFNKKEKCIRRKKRIYFKENIKYDLIIDLTEFRHV